MVKCDDSRSRWTALLFSRLHPSLQYKVLRLCGTSNGKRKYLESCKRLTRLLPTEWDCLPSEEPCSPSIVEAVGVDGTQAMMLPVDHTRGDNHIPWVDSSTTACRNFQLWLCPRVRGAFAPGNKKLANSSAAGHRAATNMTQRNSAAPFLPHTVAYCHICPPSLPSLSFFPSLSLPPSPLSFPPLPSLLPSYLCLDLSYASSLPFSLPLPFAKYLSQSHEPFLLCHLIYSLLHLLTQRDSIALAGYEVVCDCRHWIDRYDLLLAAIARRCCL